MDQNLAEMSNADEAINNPIWKNFIDDEYKPLINKQTWEVVKPPKDTNIVSKK